MTLQQFVAAPLLLCLLDSLCSEGKLVIMGRGTTAT